MIPDKHEQLGIANKTRRQPITATLGKLYVVALFISHTHQGHVFLLQALHSVRLTIVSHQNLLNVGLAVEYLSAKLDIRDDTVVSVVLQGSSAQLQPGTKLLVRHEALTVKHGAVVHHGTFKVVNHSVEVVHDVVHPLAVSCHYFIAHSCLVLLLILTLLVLLAALDKVAVVY